MVRRALVGSGLLILSLPALATAQGGLRGVHAIRGGAAVASENAERRFTPASVQKLLVAVALLDELGPDHRIVTRVAAAGPVEGGVLEGDLVVIAAGDPSWSEEFFEDDSSTPLRGLARGVAARGVRLVTGDLVVDERGFPGRGYPTSRAAAELGLGYGTATSGLAVDRNTVRIRIAPGSRVGEPGRLEAPDDVETINRMLTVSAQRDGRGSVEFLPVWGSDTVVVHGEYPISEGPYEMAVAAPSPSRHAASRFRQALKDVGVVVEGEVRLRNGPLDAPGELEELARFASPPMSELLRPVLEDSDNWHAEMLLRVLARETLGEGRLDLGLDEVERFLVEEVGVEEDDLELDDASGLSPYNLVTPRAVVAALEHAWRQPWRGRLSEVMAANGEGTLRFWPALPPLVAKTGTLRHTLALAGVVDPESPSPLFFAWFVNHDAADRRALRAEIARRLRELQKGR